MPATLATICVLEWYTQDKLRFNRFEHTHFSGHTLRYRLEGLASDWSGNTKSRSFGGYIVGLF